MSEPKPKSKRRPALKEGAGKVDRQLVQIYRTAEDYRRYTWENADRRRALASFYKKYRRYFGRSVLDLGCGGGVLGMTLERSGRSYLGVDANPDMIREARKAADERGSSQRFQMGNICRARIPGRFDTVALLGNSLAHINVQDMDELLRARKANVHVGTTFLVDYRDLVAMFWQGTWSRVKIQTHVRGKVVHRTRLLDLEEGRLRMQARPGSRTWLLDWAHAIWSPFILEAVMRRHDWRLIARSPRHGKSGTTSIPEQIVEVYRLERRRTPARPARN
jgi:2-polyprenyl-3-methyl-5-hydroxy-6-metoxy-1,4-benzoquinol methylase